MAFVIYKKAVGEVKAHVRVIWFRKRCHSHAHTISIMIAEWRSALLQPSFIDSIISADIPANKNPSLCQFVLKDNMHSPLRSVQPFCREHGWHDLHETIPKTVPEGNKARRCTAVHHLPPKSTWSWKGNSSLDKLTIRTQYHNWKYWQIKGSPNSPTLSIMFQCHLNVELCVSRVSAIKYLFKYVHKRNDRATVQLVRGKHNCNETCHHQDTRYVSASKALRRLFLFEIVDNNPNVVLDVYLENYHTVYFWESRGGWAAIQSKPSTKTTGWFAANRKWSGATHIKYIDLPCYFV